MFTGAASFASRTRRLQAQQNSRALYQRLVQAGKPAKIAIAAVMRKLFVLADSLLRDDRRWTENPPCR